MAKLNKKLIMMGLSTILIPLGKLILKKIVRRGIDKLDSNGEDSVKDKRVSTTQQFGRKHNNVRENF